MDLQTEESEPWYAGQAPPPLLTRPNGSGGIQNKYATSLRVKARRAEAAARQLC